MSFTFNFSGDDISDSELEQTSEQFNKTTISQPPSTATNGSHASIPPKRHSLKSLLETLPSQLSFNYLNIPIPELITSSSQNGSQPSSITIPRRSVFDIRQQLMAESDPTSSSDTTNTLLSGLATGDLSTGIYEGGFKTWECAVDLAGYVAAATRSNGNIGPELKEGFHVIELGAGSAIPTLVLLRDVLLQRRKPQTQAPKRPSKIRFTICDYNEDVLRLCTVANVFLTTLLIAGQGQFSEHMDDEDMAVDEGCIRFCLNALEDAGIEIDFISGAWGHGFMQIIQQNQTQDVDDQSSNHGGSSHMKTLVLASETIYSPDSLPTFTQTLSDLLALSGSDSRILVAAKKVYFGVGGGVAEFEAELRKLGGTTEVVHSVDGTGVGRVVLDVRPQR